MVSATGSTRCSRPPRSVAISRLPSGLRPMSNSSGSASWSATQPAGVSRKRWIAPSPVLATKTCPAHRVVQHRAHAAAGGERRRRQGCAATARTTALRGRGRPRRAGSARARRPAAPTARRAARCRRAAARCATGAPPADSRRGRPPRGGRSRGRARRPRRRRRRRRRPGVAACSCAGSRAQHDARGDRRSTAPAASCAADRRRCLRGRRRPAATRPAPRRSRRPPRCRRCRPRRPGAATAVALLAVQASGRAERGLPPGRRRQRRARSRRRPARGDCGAGRGRAVADGEAHRDAPRPAGPAGAQRRHRAVDARRAGPPGRRRQTAARARSVRRDREPAAAARG